MENLWVFKLFMEKFKLQLYMWNKESKSPYGWTGMRKHLRIFCLTFCVISFSILTLYWPRLGFDFWPRFRIHWLSRFCHSFKIKPGVVNRTLKLSWQLPVTLFPAHNLNLWRTKFTCILYKDPFHTSQGTQYTSITKASLCMLCNEILVACCENHMQYVHRLCGGKM
jgi:hypothetical protein